MPFTANEIFAKRYRLIKKVGMGGFSEVWQAADVMAEDAIVAIKIYAPERGMDDLGLKQFKREYVNVLHLNHPHILTAKHFDVHDGRPYLVLTYCDGGSLYGKLMEHGVMDEKTLALFVSQIAGALEYLHGKGIIHQDLKPDNILIDQNGDYLLTDFGISSRLRTTLQRTTVSSRSMTIAYTPPERFQYTGEETAAGDVFSLGVMMTELVTGKQPWGGMGGSHLRPDTTLTDLPVTFGKDLNTLIHQCLQYELSKRPTANQLKQAAELHLRKGTWFEKGLDEKNGRRKTETFTKENTPLVEKTAWEGKILRIAIWLFFIVLFAVGCYVWWDIRKEQSSTEQVTNHEAEADLVYEQEEAENKEQVQLGMVKDVDGTTYKTVKIGDQIWMAENLRTMRYNNGDKLLHLDYKDWINTTQGGWCWYDNDSSYENPYGKLYNRYVVQDDRNVCPLGWHVPSQKEWETLINHLGTRAGRKMKSTSRWMKSTLSQTFGKDGNGTNESGFSALPGGFLTKHDFKYIGRDGGWWVSTNEHSGNSYHLSYLDDSVKRDLYGEGIGLSIRCLKDRLLESSEELKKQEHEETDRIANKETPSWGTWETLYSDTDIKVEISYKLGDCNSSKPCQYKYKVSGKLKKTEYKHKWMLSYLDCDGRIVNQLNSVELGPNGIVGEIRGIDYQFNCSSLKKQEEAYMIAKQKGTHEQKKKNEQATIAKQKEAEKSEQDQDETMTDPRDGRTYKIIKIGTQVWMAENLNYSTSTGSWCYDNENSNCAKYGMLYDWNTAKKVCPSGWHLPSDGEWEKLLVYLGGNYSAGGKLKSTTGWDSPNTQAINSSGFSALPGGSKDNYGFFSSKGNIGYFWSSSEYSLFSAWYRSLDYRGVNRSSGSTGAGFSCRCMRD